MKWWRVPAQLKLITSRSIYLGLMMAAAAIALRLLVPADVGGQQAIFSFPAIVLATIMFGGAAGVVTGLICFVVLWYFVLPDVHSFAIADAQTAITLTVFAIVAVALIAAISTMRVALTQYRLICDSLEQTVELRTAERNRVWERSTEVVVILTTDLTIQAANPAFARTLGGWPATPNSVSFKSRLVKSDASELDHALARLTAFTGATKFQARLVTAEGVRHFDWNMVDDDGWYYLVGRDVTDVHECEEELLRLNS